MRRALLALLALVLTLAAAIARAEEPATFTVVLSGGRIQPAVLEVPAQRRIKLVIRNESSGPIEFESTDLRVEKVLVAGATSFVVIAPQKPGRYRFFDEFHPDTAQMTLLVR